MYLQDEGTPDRVFVFATNAGADKNPASLSNVTAHPHGLQVEIGTATVTADAEILVEPLRTQFYEEQARRFSGFAAYQALTARTIPVVALDLLHPARLGDDQVLGHGPLV